MYIGNIIINNFYVPFQNKFEFEDDTDRNEVGVKEKEKKISFTFSKVSLNM